MTCGIYILRFNGTNKVYIGLSDNIERRYINHKYNFRNNICESKLYKAFLEYGMPNMEILCECDKKDLDRYEIEAIDIFNSIDNGFNTRNGGVVGSLNLYGDKNPKSKYSNTKIIEVFELLLKKSLTYKQIADLTGVSYEAVTHVANGTGHMWLKDIYKDKYTEFQEYRKNKPKINYNLNIYIVNYKTNVEVLINSYEELVNLTGCKYSTAVAFLAGINKTLFDAWKLKDLQGTVRKNKKPIYTFKCNESIINTTSITKYFKDNNLVNIKKFREFVKNDDNIGKSYQNVVLLNKNAQ